MGWQARVYGQSQGSLKFRRKRPKKAIRDALMAAQGRRCFYCDRPYGSSYRWRGKVYRVTVEWDHVIPFSHGIGNPDDNWVAACRKCNGVKSNLVFDSREGARDFVRKMLDASGVSEAREIQTQDGQEVVWGMPKAVPTSAGLPEVVQPQVPHDCLLAATLEYRHGQMRGYRLHPHRTGT